MLATTWSGAWIQTWKTAFLILRLVHLQIIHFIPFIYTYITALIVCMGDQIVWKHKRHGSQATMADDLKPAINQYSLARRLAKALYTQKWVCLKSTSGVWYLLQMRRQMYQAEGHNWLKESVKRIQDKQRIAIQEIFFLLPASVSREGISLDLVQGP